MAELGQAYVQIVPSAKGIKGSIENELSPEASSAGGIAGEKITAGIKGKMSGLGKKLMAGGAIATAISVPLIAGIKKSLDAYEVQEAAEVKLTEIYKTRMGATEGAAKATMELASSLQKVGVVGDEVTLSGAQQLATFAKYPETVNTLLPAMDNLLVQQKGLNGTAQDATSIANLMGKAMQGQTGALRRVGISFDENQEKILKYGTEQEKAAVLAEVITQNVGNMNEEMAKTDLGKIQQTKNTFGDLLEQLGGALAPAISALLPIIQRIVPVITNILNFISEHPAIGKIVIALTAVLAIGGPIVTLLGTFLTILPMLLGPIGLVIAAIAGAIAIGIAIYKNWDKIKAFLINIWNAIKSAAQNVWNVIKAVIFGPTLAVINLIWNNWTKIRTVLLTIWNGIKNSARVVWNVIKTVTLAPVLAIKTGITTTWNAIRSITSRVWNGIKRLIVTPIQTAWNTVKGIIDKIKGLFPLSVGKIFSNIKLPHFNITGGKAPWGIGGLGTKPTISIDWYAKGGVFDAPSIIGVGERGPEAVVPLDRLWSKLDNIAKGAGGTTTINVYGSPGMSVEELAGAVERKLIQSENRRRLAWQP